MATGGSVESVSFAGREFAVAADANANIKIGGFENEVSPNGNATARQLKTRVPCSVTGLSLEIDHENDDLTFLQDAADRKIFDDFTVTLAGGAIYQGTCQITGELQGSTATATGPVNFTGPGKLTLQ